MAIKTIKYKNRNQITPFNGTKTKGKSLTRGGDALSVRDMFIAHQNNIPIPINIPIAELPSINEVLEDSFDIPDISKFHDLDLVDQQTISNRLSNLKEHLTNEVERKRKEMEEHFAKMNAANAEEQTPPEGV